MPPVCCGAVVLTVYVFDLLLFTLLCFFTSFSFTFFYCPVLAMPLEAPCVKLVTISSLRPAITCKVTSSSFPSGFGMSKRLHFESLFSETLTVSPPPPLRFFPRISADWHNFWCRAHYVVFLDHNPLPPQSHNSHAFLYSLRNDVFYFTNTKADLIHKFEINLSVYMRQRGFSVQAMHTCVPLNISQCSSVKRLTFCSYADVVHASDSRETQAGLRPSHTLDDNWPRNPTHYFFRTLVTKVMFCSSPRNCSLCACRCSDV
jgi:hypothetical protein